MKQKFNIKRISICLLTFLCMFLATTKVSAENTMDSVINDIKETSGVKSCIYVQYKTDTVILELAFNSSNITITNRINGLLDSYKNAKFSPQFKVSDLNGECPSLLFLGTADGKGEIPVKLENFDGATMKLGKKTKIEDIKDTITNAENNDFNPNDYVTCEYADGSPDKILIKMIIGPNEVSLTNKFYLVGDIPSGMEKFKQFEKVTFEPNFGVKDLNRTCPKNLYVGKPDNVFVAPVTLKKLNSTILRVSLVKKISEIGAEEMTIEEDICEGKTVEFVKTIFNLIRFLVPIIIIVLSIINFIGVVISGENDKMEKAKKNFIIRLLIGFAILIVPALLELILKLAGLIDSDLATATCNLFK